MGNKLGVRIRWVAILTGALASQPVWAKTCDQFVDRVFQTHGLQSLSHVRGIDGVGKIQNFGTETVPVYSFHKIPVIKEVKVGKKIVKTKESSVSLNTTVVSGQWNASVVDTKSANNFEFRFAATQKSCDLEWIQVRGKAQKYKVADCERTLKKADDQIAGDAQMISLKRACSIAKPYFADPANAPKAAGTSPQSSEDSAGGTSHGAHY